MLHSIVRRFWLLPWALGSVSVSTPLSYWALACDSSIGLGRLKLREQTPQ